jgi:hypothetical protein
MLGGQSRKTLSHAAVWAMSMDPHPAVRRVAAGYQSMNSLQQLLFDADPSTSATAMATLKSMEGLPTRVVSLRTRLRKVSAQLLIPVVAFLALVALGQLADDEAPSPSYPGFQMFPATPFAVTETTLAPPSIVAWKLDPERPPSVAQRTSLVTTPRFAPICVTESGARIWAQSVQGVDAVETYVKAAFVRADVDLFVYPSVIVEDAVPAAATVGHIALFEDSISALGWSTDGEVGEIRLEIREVPPGDQRPSTYQVTIPFGPDAAEPTATGGCQ